MKPIRLLCYNVFVRPPPPPPPPPPPTVDLAVYNFQKHSYYFERPVYVDIRDSRDNPLRWGSSPVILI